jgi:hypothetical protein
MAIAFFFGGFFGISALPLNDTRLHLGHPPADNSENLLDVRQCDLVEAQLISYLRREFKSCRAQRL